MRASAIKVLAASALAVMAATSVASAADMAPRYTKAPPAVVEVWNWTGFYIGGNVGYSWGRGSTDVSYFNTLTGVPIVSPAGSILGAGYDMNGAIAGGRHDRHPGQHVEVGNVGIAAAPAIAGVAADIEAGPVPDFDHRGRRLGVARCDVSRGCR